MKAIKTTHYSPFYKFILQQALFPSKLCFTHFAMCMPVSVLMNLSAARFKTDRIKLCVLNTTNKFLLIIYILFISKFSTLPFFQ